MSGGRFRYIWSVNNLFFYPFLKTITFVAGYLKEVVGWYCFALIFGFVLQVSRDIDAELYYHKHLP